MTAEAASPMEQDARGRRHGLDAAIPGAHARLRRHGVRGDDRLLEHLVLRESRVASEQQRAILLRLRELLPGGGRLADRRLRLRGVGPLQAQGQRALLAARRRQLEHLSRSDGTFCSTSRTGSTSRRRATGEAWRPRWPSTCTRWVWASGHCGSAGGTAGGSWPEGSGHGGRRAASAGVSMSTMPSGQSTAVRLSWARISPLAPTGPRNARSDGNLSRAKSAGTPTAPP